MSQSCSTRDVEDPVRRNHDAEVDHLVAVAAEDDADDVLADVVHVALHGRHHDAGCRGALRLLRLHVRLEVRDRALHRARALHDLRQEHLPGAEEVADDLHPVHERPLDDVERPRGLAPRLLRVLLDEVDDAVHERVREPLATRAPRATTRSSSRCVAPPVTVAAYSTSRSVASGAGRRGRPRRARAARARCPRRRRAGRR